MNKNIKKATYRFPSERPEDMELPDDLILPEGVKRSDVIYYDPETRGVLIGKPINTRYRPPNLRLVKKCEP